MTGRDDLNELQALAASIAAEQHGWRARRRHRHEAAARARLEAQMVAPVRRRRRHRWIAGAAVAVTAVVAVVLVVTHKPGHPAEAPTRTSTVVKHESSQARLGHQAAADLTLQGRIPNLFACQGWYDQQQLATVPQQRDPIWRQGYLSACAGGR